MSNTYYYGDTHIFTSRGTGNITIKAGANETLVFPGSGGVANKYYISTYDTTATLTVSTLNLDWVKIPMAACLANVSNGFTVSSIGKITYTGAINSKFLINYNVSGISSIVFNAIVGIAINGVMPTIQTQQRLNMGVSPNTRIAAATFIVSLAPGDFLELYVYNATNSAVLTVYYPSIVINEI